MTPLGDILRRRIAASGPIPFLEFMDCALYHPNLGYYVRPHDPFGKHGDFYTAPQLQPVFGRLMRRIVSALAPPPATIVDLGAGRREMFDAFRPWRYVAVDWNGGELPAAFEGVVFANEFFDALPVDVFEAAEGMLYRRLVDYGGGSFHWVRGEPAVATTLPDGCLIERCPSARTHLEAISRSMTSGYVLVIDYGYTERERVRFPQGTLMSYRSHHADPDVLVDPGERDITAHVNFTELQGIAVQAGFEVERFETLASMLLRVGKEDAFAAVLEGDAHHYRQQLKTLLFGMGETFRTLLLRKAK